MKRYAHDMNRVLSSLTDTAGLLSESEAASIIGVSPRRFRSIFTKTFGESFRVRRVRVRLQAARTLLLETRDPIIEISTKLGYSNRDKLEKAFKQMFHVTPAEFRKTIPPRK